jgi:hypothetical protein
MRRMYLTEVMRCESWDLCLDARWNRLVREEGEERKAREEQVCFSSAFEEGYDLDWG